MSDRLSSHINRQKKSQQPIIGLVPAGGEAKRIAPLPCSKELYPVGFHRAGRGRSLRPKVICHYLLENMRLAGATKAYVILRKSKWDIPAYLGDGTMLDMHLAYLILNLPFGVPYTLDQAYPFVQDAMVVFGFPDIVFQPNDAFLKLLSKQAECGADVVLGVFPAYQPHKCDMVDLNTNGQIRKIEIKPSQTNLSYTWIIAVWTPLFTEFMHEFILTNQSKRENKRDGTSVELFVGDVIQAALNNRLLVESVVFSDGAYLDIGTPDDLVKALGKNTLKWHF